MEGLPHDDPSEKLGHALLDAEGPIASREIAEVEVESVAFIVCDALGFESGEYSFPYVTRWADGSTEVVKETAEQAIGCAKEILVALEAPGRGGGGLATAVGAGTGCDL